MIRNAGHISPEEIAKLARDSRRVYFKSKFCFLNQHNGLRPGNVHVFLGTAGSGKSTFMRSIIGDFVEQNLYNIFAWQSEETIAELQTAFIKQGTSTSALTKLNVYSELEGDFNIEQILESVVFTDSKVLVIDNITTSKFYKGLDAQEKFLMRLKNFASAHQIAVVMVAHTKKGISDNAGSLIVADDIRETGTIVNLAQFFYILQRFEIAKTFAPTLRIVKHRGQAVDEKIYSLEYDRKTMSYVLDVQRDFELIASLNKNRNKFGN